MRWVMVAEELTVALLAGGAIRMELAVAVEGPAGCAAPTRQSAGTVRHNCPRGLVRLGWGGNHNGPIGTVALLKGSPAAIALCWGRSKADALYNGLRQWRRRPRRQRRATLRADRAAPRAMAVPSFAPHRERRRLLGVYRPDSEGE